MKTLLFVLAIAVTLTGCCSVWDGAPWCDDDEPGHPAWPEFYGADPSRAKAHGTLGWLYMPSYEAYADALVQNGWNAVMFPYLGCAENEVPVASVLPAKYWAWHDQNANLKARARQFLDVMLSRKIAVYIGITSGNFEGVCGGEFDDDWFRRQVQFFVDYANARGSYEGMILAPVNELGHSDSAACYGKLRHWHDIANQMWPGRKLWNGDGGRPHAIPAGWEGVQYTIEYHPQQAADLGPAGCLIHNDGPINISLWNDGGRCLNVDVAAPYYQKIRNSGRGYAVFLHRFDGDIDIAGIQGMAVVQ